MSAGRAATASAAIGAERIEIRDSPPLGGRQRPPAEARDRERKIEERELSEERWRWRRVGLEMTKEEDKIWWERSDKRERKTSIPEEAEMEREERGKDTRETRKREESLGEQGVLLEKRGWGDYSERERREKIGVNEILRWRREKERRRVSEEKNLGRQEVRKNGEQRGS
ncbi:hypothetical protein Tco_0574379 [Tanacetum coccineum]